MAIIGPHGRLPKMMAVTSTQMRPGAVNPMVTRIFEEAFKPLVLGQDADD